MFGANHYVPILRWKRAEKIALRHLKLADKVAITPLIELIPANFKPGRDGDERDPADVLNRQAEEIRKNWGTTPFFIDFGHVDGHLTPISGGTHPLKYLRSRADLEGITPIPVTGLNRGASYQDAVTHVASTGSGACLRISPREVLQSGFAADMIGLATRLHLDCNKIDLVLDFQVFDPSAPTLATLVPPCA